ncbi:MAG: histidinol-phosphate transaminase [Acidimicrobiia bacterium]
MISEVTGSPPQAKAAIAALPSYRPGRSAAQAMAEHGLDSAIKLASNEVPWAPLPAVAKAIADAATGVNRYPDHGAAALRAAIATHLGVDAERVAVGCGSVGLLQQLCLTYAGWGDEVVYGWRSFEAYPILTQIAGAQGVTAPLVNETIDARNLVAALSRRTRLVLVANPNNPTGTAMTGRDLRFLAESLPEGCLLVVDEAYREFVRDPSIADALDLLGHRPNVVVLRTFSKAHGLAALRVGYLVGAPEIVDAVDRTLIPFAVNALGQAGAMAALSVIDQTTTRIDELVAERDRVMAAVRAFGLAAPASHANFVWLPVRRAAVALAERLEREGVVARAFDGDGIRVTIGTHEENDRFLDAIRRCR